VEYRKFWQPALSLILVLGAVMLIFFTVAVVLLYQSGGSPGNVTIIAIGLGIILMLLGSGGMTVLLYWGKRTENRLTFLEELTLPLAKKNYPELAVLSLTAQGTEDVEAYAELQKSLRDLGLFIQSFKTHALGIVEVDALFSKAVSALGNEGRETAKGAVSGIAEVLKELESSLDQAEAAVREIADVCTSDAGRNHPVKVFVNEGQPRFEHAWQSEQAAQSKHPEQLMVKLLGESSELLGKLKTQIDNGQDQSQTTYVTIKAASKELDKIIEMADVINKIAEKSNILSMNAAIESAHAGASGSGFAVVADEIRKLADSTSENANSIQTVLRSITQQIHDALKASQTSSEAFGTLNTAVENFAQSLDAAGKSAEKTLYDTQSSISSHSEAAGAPILSDTVPKNLKALLQDVRSLCAKVKTADEGQRKDSVQFRRDLEVSLATFSDYLKEAEALEHVLSGNNAKSVTPYTEAADFASETTARTLPTEKDHLESADTKIDPSDPVVDRGNSKHLCNDRIDTIHLAKDQVIRDTVTKDNGANEHLDKDHAASNSVDKGQAAAVQDDNSWRKDVAVKTPPRTVY